MPAQLLQAPARADVGDTYRAWLRVTDLDGVWASADSIALAITQPASGADTGTATEQDTTGLYLLEYDLTEAGRHAMTVTITDATFGDDVINFIVRVDATSGAGALPDAADVKTYLGDDNSYTDAEIADALAAETAAQARRCTIPADYPQDLAQALKRRCARNLAARSVPVASYTSFEGVGTAARVPRLDAEIARLEGPYLRLVAG